MTMNHDGHRKNKNMHNHTHHRMKITTGFAFGAFIGTLIGICAVQNIERVIASGKLSDVKDAMASMKDHTLSMGAAVRSTVHTIKKAVGKGSEKIMHEAEDGIEDLEKSL